MFQISDWHAGSQPGTLGFPVDRAIPGASNTVLGCGNVPAENSGYISTVVPTNASLLRRFVPPQGSLLNRREARDALLDGRVG